VALALLIRLEEPYLFASTSLYQATINTFLIAPQAITHVHLEAGCTITLADLYFTFKSYGTVQLSICTFTNFFLASVIDFAIASTTSQDFQVPRATLPLPSQITITALNLNCLQPEVTLVTLSIAKSSSLNSFLGFENLLFFVSFLGGIAIILNLYN
jgi:hypothetical protein